MSNDRFAEWEADTRGAPVDCVVRVGTDVDIEACVAVAAEIGLEDLDAWRGTLARTIQDGEQRVLHVADVGSDLVGYGRVVYAPSLADPVGRYLLGVAVSPRWRRRGIGEALTRSRMRWVAERSTAVYYFTHRDNRASQALHEQLGFLEVSGPFRPPGGTPEIATHQRLYVASV